MTDLRVYAEEFLVADAPTPSLRVYGEEFLVGERPDPALRIYGEEFLVAYPNVTALRLSALEFLAAYPAALNATADGATLTVTVSIIAGAASAEAGARGDVVTDGVSVIGDEPAGASATADGMLATIGVTFRAGYARVQHVIPPGDIATVWDAGQMAGDWLLRAPSLDTDSGLRTAILISLFTDRMARADDPLPDGTGDRRGWWGDMTLAGDAPDEIGSRLWLLARAKATEATRQRAEGYIREALGWLVTDGVAASFDIATEWQGEALDRLAIAIRVNRAAGSAEAASRFDFTWAAELAR